MSDENFRDWAKEIHDKLEAQGLRKTGDSGEIHPSRSGYKLYPYTPKEKITVDIRRLPFLFFVAVIGFVLLFTVAITANHPVIVIAFILVALGLALLDMRNATGG